MKTSMRPPCNASMPLLSSGKIVKRDFGSPSGGRLVDDHPALGCARLGVALGQRREVDDALTPGVALAHGEGVGDAVVGVTEQHLPATLGSDEHPGGDHVEAVCLQTRDERVDVVSTP